MRIRALAGGLACTCALGLAAACGGGDEPEPPSGAAPSAWAANFCNAITDAAAERAQASVKYLGRFRTARDPRAARASLINYTRLQIGQTDAMLAQIRELGPPAVQDGVAAQADVERAILAMRAAMARALDDARGFPVENRQVLTRAFAVSARKLERDMTEAGGMFDRVGENRELERAVAAEPACKTR